MNRRSMVMAGMRIAATTTSTSALIAADPSSGKYPTHIAIAATGAGAYIKVGNNFGAVATNADLLIQPGDSIVLSVDMMQYVAAMAVSGTSTVSVASLSLGLWSNELAAPVAAMFASGMKGAWYERSNQQALYQESTGTTPAATAGQPVGLGLSRDQGLVRGAEMVVNGTFNTDMTGWTTTSVTQSVVAGEAEVVALSSAGPTSSEAITLVIGKWYEITGKARAAAGNAVAQSARVQVTAGSTYQMRFQVPTNGVSATFHSVFQATIAAAAVELGVASLNNWGNAGDKAYFDDISIKELAGNHQLQATAAARPLYQITPQRIVFDGIDDVLNASFPATLGANCTIGRAIPGTGAAISTAQNIGTTYADSVTACALVILDGPLNTAQTASLTAYLNQQSVT